MDLRKQDFLSQEKISDASRFLTNVSNEDILSMILLLSSLNISIMLNKCIFQLFRFDVTTKAQYFEYFRENKQFHHCRDRQDFKLKMFLH